MECEWEDEEVIIKEFVINKEFLIGVSDWYKKVEEYSPACRMHDALKIKAVRQYIVYGCGQSAAKQSRILKENINIWHKHFFSITLNHSVLPVNSGDKFFSKDSKDITHNKNKGC